MPFQKLPYQGSLSLFTDLYQITMAYAYWKSRMDSTEAAFHLYFRENPFKGGFTVSCGLEYAIDFLQNFRLDESDLSYLKEMKGNDGRVLFEPAFLDYLSRLEFTCDIDAIPEGTVVFPQEPLMRVCGPIIQCQILESALLNIINYQSLIATKAARMFIASDQGTILEFGLRRAHGIDGALAASRAAYAGGCSATSNMLAGKQFGIPVRGTHAHSWVMAFDSELEAFMEYAKAMPNNCIFLVDTYHTLEGVKNAVKAGEWLRSQNHEMTGIRIDSGDLAYFSKEARKILDAGGFPNAKIVASNDLDENIIVSLKEQGAPIDIWGIGTKLVSGHDDPALGGVYKLSAVKKPGEDWKYRLKLSEQGSKNSIPGILQVRRFYDEHGAAADAIYQTAKEDGEPWKIIDPYDYTRQKDILSGQKGEDLLQPVFRKGKKVYPEISIHQIRENTLRQLGQFHEGIKRFVNPHRYPAGLEKSLFDLRLGMIRDLRKGN